jgi:hypothetical protein
MNCQCKQCGAPLNPVAVMLGPVCGKCVRANHRAAVEGERPDPATRSDVTIYGAGGA